MKDIPICAGATRIFYIKNDKERAKAWDRLVNTAYGEIKNETKN